MAVSSHIAFFVLLVFWFHVHGVSIELSATVCIWFFFLFIKKFNNNKKRRNGKSGQCFVDVLVWARIRYCLWNCLLFHVILCRGVYPQQRLCSCCCCSLNVNSIYIFSHTKWVQCIRFVCEWLGVLVNSSRYELIEFIHPSSILIYWWMITRLRKCTKKKLGEN